MEEKNSYQRDQGIGLFLYFIPMLGLFLLWKDRNQLSKLHLLFGTVFGILSLLLMANEVVKYNLI